MLICLFICYSCVNLNKPLILKGDVYERILIYNDLDTLNGYCTFRNDSVFFIPKVHFENCKVNINKEYYRWYLMCVNNTDRVYGLRDLSSKCKMEILVDDGRNVVNMVYPIETINNTLIKVKHISVDYLEESLPTIREYFFDENFKLKKFKTIQKNNENYFFYD